MLGDTGSTTGTQTYAMPEPKLRLDQVAPTSTLLNSRDTNEPAYTRFESVGSTLIFRGSRASKVVPASDQLAPPSVEMRAVDLSVLAKSLPGTLGSAVMAYP